MDVCSHVQVCLTFPLHFSYGFVKGLRCFSDVFCHGFALLGGDRLAGELIWPNRWGSPIHVLGLLVYPPVGGLNVLIKRHRFYMKAG